ncbi:MAG TPA: EAL domain-containing protein [Candidatus Dormibacteraeota bacterium]|nr:EAL domain-containing protein [Candidatus Dormibacteraeota bacterium]
MTGVVAVAAVALTVGVLHGRQSVAGQVVIPWWGLSIAYLLSGILVAHITVRNQAYTFTLSEVPMVLGLVAASPTALITGGFIGTALSLVLYRRQQPVKVIFNLATFLVEASVAIVVMQALLGGHTVGSSFGWLATLAGTVTSSALAQVVVLVIVVASAGALPIRQVARTLAFMLPASVLNTILGLSGLHVAGQDPQLAALLLIPCVVLAAAYRSYLSERQRHGQVRQLFEASGALHRSRGVDASIATMLSRARDMFNAEVAELILLPAVSPGEARRFTMGPGDGPVIATTEDAGDRGELALRQQAVVLGPGGPPGVLAARGWRDGIAVSVSADGGVNGALLIGNRRDTVSSFGRADLDLLEAFAGPASVSLANGRLEAKLEHQAFHDSLTGLANRALLAQRIQTALLHGPRDDFAVLLLDVDDFKTVNDTLGHPAGDQLLIEIAQRLSSCLEPADTAARLGGDEFAVMLRSTARVDDAVAVADRILAALRRPFNLAAWDVTVRGSIGVVIDNPSVASVDDLLSSADIAMYRAKAQGKDQCVVFEPLMHVEVLARHQLRADLERAVSGRELRVHYQPIVSLTTGEVIGAEALVRWAHPVRGMVGPDEFIPIAEESGLIVPLGRFVLDEACRQLSAWQRTLPSLHLSVNVSARQLQEPELVNDVAGIFARHGVNPNRLTLEVTEHVMVNDARAVDALRDLRSRGTKIAVDDFGTGYSSLSCLRDLPIDSLKIAKPFVDRLARSDDDRALATSVVGLAHSLRLDTVAEGIERPDQAEVLRAAGCRCGQGFLFSRALPAAEFLARFGSQKSTAPFLSLAG